VSQIVRPATAFSLDSLRQKQPRVKDRGHLAFLRSLPCLVTGRSDGIEAAHIRFADDTYAKRGSGLQQKPHDCWAVPLSADEHRRQHSISERDYWIDTGIDPVLIAALLYCHSGDDNAARQVIRNARAITQRTLRP
jgi:hypothetical protein